MKVVKAGCTSVPPALTIVPPVVVAFTDSLASDITKAVWLNGPWARTGAASSVLRYINELRKALYTSMRKSEMSKLEVLAAAAQEVIAAQIEADIRSGKKVVGVQ